ncbi:MAG: deoxyribodipyrimidine photo-lyase [Alcanivoracaceae bacterium]|nr:deoxyribodipyrimidine photo-lyase [Alcanivoracaceae bacterium]
MTALVWYRNDLRTLFHSPLSAALKNHESVKALYILSEGQWDIHDVAPVRRWYVLHSLRELGQSLAAMGVTLDVVVANTFSEVGAQLERYVIANKITTIYCNREYPLNEIQRDRDVATRLSALDVSIQGFDDGMVVPPKVLKTNQGGHYTIFTPYKRKWLQYLIDEPQQSFKVSSTGADKSTASFSCEVLDNAIRNNVVPEALTRHWTPGESAAQSMLASFIESRKIEGYQQQRDFPAIDGTSMLSTALSAGTISAHQCVQMAKQCSGVSEAQQGVQTWISELCWRDFYRQVMANHSRLAKGEPFRPETRFIQWSRDVGEFNTWCEGRTGYPLVDAAMRQLVATGWMHNRLRMVVAMFLTKQLFIDWRWGETFFMRHLIDGDFAANNGGWQWSASTGTDAVPYFRVFNPVRQGQRFDPDGVFIKQWVPELAHLSKKFIHEPWKSPESVSDYPTPIVSLVGVKENVERAFRAARDLAKTELI